MRDFASREIDCEQCQKDGHHKGEETRGMTEGRGQWITDVEVTADNRLADQFRFEASTNGSKEQNKPHSTKTHHNRCNR